MDHLDRVRDQFTRQAATAATVDAWFDNREVTDWIGQQVPFDGPERVLDVGGGAGHLSRALRHRAREFVVADATRAMLDVGAAAAADEGIDNVLFVEADAYALPFTDAAFDVVMCRFSLHHMEAPEAAVQEMVRVCRSDGVVVVVDMVSLRDEVADDHNRIERARDPSHTAALSADAVLAALRDAGADLREHVFRDQTMLFEPWLAQASPNAEAAAQVTAAIERELDGGAPTGLRPQRRFDGARTITQRWICAVARAG